MIEAVLAEVERLLRGVAAAAPFVADWPVGGLRRSCAAETLPVCRWLGQLDRDVPLVAAVMAAAGHLTWRQTYGAADLRGAADFGAAFLRGYGWSEFIGLRGPVPSTELACGVLLLAPGVVYPPHAHQAAEVYLPLSGTAEWQQGDGGFVPVPPGSVISHAPWVPHAMRAGPEPMLALYLWRGGDLAAKSVIL